MESYRRKQQRCPHKRIGVLKLLKVREFENKIAVTSPYNSAFINAVKQIGGRWLADTKEWAIDADNKDLLADLLTKYYGNNPFEESEKIVVTFDAYDFSDNYTIRLGDLIVAKRNRRDSPVTLAAGAVVTSGSFPTSGGSRGNPSVAVDKGTIIRLSIDKQFYDNLPMDTKEKMDIVNINKVDRVKELKARKDKLLAELAEIEAELKEI